MEYNLITSLLHLTKGQTRMQSSIFPLYYDLCILYHHACCMFWVKALQRSTKPMYNFIRIQCKILIKKFLKINLYLNNNVMESKNTIGKSWTIRIKVEKKNSANGKVREVPIGAVLSFRIRLSVLILVLSFRTHRTPETQTHSVYHHGSTKRCLSTHFVGKP